MFRSMIAALQGSHISGLRNCSHKLCSKVHLSIFCQDQFYYFTIYFKRASCEYLLSGEEMNSGRVMV